ncbi:MAG TPA: acylhydrolase [Candidatus Acetatifactor stercoripullorum]|uniref:Acylhydrolase n=1 Tax=Candidatus Acetatifactor stercoripullorum TaxID=2838414 RepID=A0A9D1R756_9FIRM|nr:GDSL-type esterase/lipase family protein [Candidatus Acetatifactor stercoripullorum]HIW82130.1 acylhydrolase [Candidatus Acetatifactor stercoripullorum]
MKKIQKYTFLVMLFVFGAVYLTFGDNWQVYAKPLWQMRSWYQETMAGGEETVSAGDSKEEGFGSISGSDSVSDSDSVSGSDNADDSLQEESQAPATGEGDGTENLTGQGDQNGQSQEPPQLIVSRRPEDVEYRTVEDDYFKDALFIGDSRTVGLYDYGGLEDTATFYASTGLTIYKLLDAEIVTVPGQKEKLTVEEALQQYSFSKIYLMIGINEMGTGTVETFMEKYKEVVNRIQELQPNAIIYLQGIMKVTTERSSQGDYITNEGIEARNTEIEKLADYVKVYYLDVNPLICDETGGMNPDYTFDGVHLKAQYVTIWKDFLKSHAL